MRSRVVRGSVAMMVLALTFMLSGFATFSTHNLVNGIVGKKYWIDSSASVHETSTDDAIAAWNATSTDFSYSQTSTRSSALLEFWKLDEVYDWWAATTFYKGGLTRAEPTTEDWVWNKVKFAADYGDVWSRKAVCVHEIGHSLGLAHVFSGTAIMRADIGQQTFPYKTPQTDDVNGVNFLY